MMPSLDKVVRVILLARLVLVTSGVLLMNFEEAGGSAVDLNMKTGCPGTGGRALWS